MTVNVEGLKKLDSIIMEIKKEGDLSHLEYIGLCYPKDITGIRQDTESSWNHEYVNQKTGSCSDDFYGDLYIPIGKDYDYYLHFYYNA